MLFSAGANRALSPDNKPITVSNLYKLGSSYPNISTSWVMDDHEFNNPPYNQPIEVSGAYNQSATPSLEAIANSTRNS
jgi:hypothetical protein